MLEEESINKRLLQHCGFKSTDDFGGLSNELGLTFSAQGLFFMSLLGKRLRKNIQSSLELMLTNNFWLKEF